MNKSQTRTVEKRIDNYHEDLNNYRENLNNYRETLNNHEEFIPEDYSSQNDYYTSSETSTAIFAEIPAENAEIMSQMQSNNPEKNLDNTNFLQQTPYVQGQSGSYYTGRVGLPTPVFNLDVQRRQPGPRFRNEMLLPKRFRGKICLKDFQNCKIMVNCKH